ncbi:MAG TPA: AbrB family transcriptional regulator [Candidatus Desulfovibrio intestinavium]|uniref:AbrB family transcriptional regulator n=1 Tax=Candidatus Desulfovibrio intestinavium TaxID=2838534 RepID=A0A9D2HM04_9BACT|nr:AbrB family transcriptional regulator [Candidatus Desulfovibrio intestinavium]
MSYAFPLLVLAGTAGGLLFHWLYVPGGAMFGAVLAVLAVKLLGQVMTLTPSAFQLASQIAIGIFVGNMLTSEGLLEIRKMAGLMLGSTMILVLAGCLGAWFVSRQAGLSAADAVLATSPGGLQAVVGLAVDMGESAPTVMAFHIVRLYTVIILAPLLSWLLHHFLR